MKRRGFLGLLLALPFAPLVAKALPKLPSPSLLDVARAGRQDGALLPVIEVLSKKNPLLQDMVWSSDQTSIWLINWAPPRGRMHSRPQMTYAMWRDKMDWDTKWKDLSEYILPRRKS